jgi:ADP-ribose pyrophosphatase YjhB (NUDIX family)
LDADVERVPCVGAVIRDESGRTLMVRRARQPAAGFWSLPGGRVEPGESAEQAVIREVSEETGLEVRVERRVGSVLRDGPGGVVYDIEDYSCTVVGGVLSAGDDAADVGWFELACVDPLTLSPGLLEALREWGLHAD